MPNAYQTIILSESGLIHYYELDETSGTTAADSKGVLNGTHGGSNSVTVNQVGIPAGGKSVLYLGNAGSTASSYTQISTGFATGGTGVTIEAWVYLSETVTENKTIASHSSGSTFGVTLYLASGRIPKFFAGDGSGHTITADGAISTGAWHHIVGVAPTSGAMKLYVDGVVQTTTISLGTPIDISTSMSLFIGGGNSFGFPDATFQIDEVAVYNAPLDATTTLGHYNAGVTAPDHPLPVSTGVFVETGNAIGLLASRKLAPSTGVYTLSFGTSIGFPLGRSLVFDRGQFTETGNPISFLLEGEFSLPFGAGSFAEEGIDLGLYADRTLPIGPMAFLETGNDIALRFGAAYTGGEPIADGNITSVFYGTPVGYNPWMRASPTGDLCGLRLHKLDAATYAWTFILPGNLTIPTGLTFTFTTVDDREFATDAGKTIRLGIVFKRLSDGESLSFDSGAGAERTKDITLDTTSSQIDISTLDVALADLDGALPGDRVAVRVRRIGSAVQDTAQGSIILIGVSVANT